MIPGAVRILPGIPGLRPEVWRIDPTPDRHPIELRAAARELTARLGGTTSRSYAGRWAVVASFDGPVGVDIEAITPCPPGFADCICTPDEARDTRAAGDPDRHLTDLWASKEALAKALGDALAYDPARLGSPIHWPDARAGRWRTTRLDCPPGHLGWVCWTPR